MPALLVLQLKSFRRGKRLDVNLRVIAAKNGESIPVVLLRKGCHDVGNVVGCCLEWVLQMW